jgi:hypothetical protein
MEPNRKEQPTQYDAVDPVVERLQKDIDFSVVERNLRLTTEERAQQLLNATRFLKKYRPLVSGANS